MRHFTSYHQISDCAVNIDTKSADNSSAPCYIRFINCYSPTNPKSVQNPQIADKFYDQLVKALDVPARYEVWFLGDFNAKLGKRSRNDEENGLSSHIGKHGVGRRNEFSCIAHIVCSQHCFLTCQSPYYDSNWLD